MIEGRQAGKKSLIESLSESNIQFSRLYEEIYESFKDGEIDDTETKLIVAVAEKTHRKIESLVSAVRQNTAC